MKKRRCAIYTRKSTEEGLDQEFNTLDAQRSACEAYILSQASEGWEPLPEHYDDGGWSGGNMERPALRKLLKHISEGRVDIVVVYKVDRLTRSLMDFSRIVESFDKHEVSFVSVTQAFNTTNSMGRLTLNVLLSFAQFEREVTGERIRDKIAASKARGIWMGGTIPLGYDVKARKLHIINAEAELVRHIFTRYLELGSVLPLVRELDATGKRTKRWTSRAGNERGGARFSCGAVYCILANRIYLGDIIHKGKAYPGEHEAIISPELFNAVAESLQSKRVKRTNRKEKATSSPLTGKLFDSDGLPMRPTFGHGRGKRIYRYYVSETLLPFGQTSNSHNKAGQRLSATRLERVLTNALLKLLPESNDAEKLFRAISRIRVRDHTLRVSLELAALLGDDEIDDDVLDRARTFDPAAKIDERTLVVSISGQAIRRGKTMSAPTHILDDAERRKLLADLVRKSHGLLDRVNASPALPDQHMKMVAPINDWGRRRVAIGLLAPDIQKMLLQRKAPAHITPDMLLGSDLPLDWDEQRRFFGS